MKSPNDFRVALVTSPNARVSRKLASAALEHRTAACVNVLPGIESHYWWKGKKERSREQLLIFKTTRQKIAALQKIVLREHPYETPEFVVLPILAGSRDYLAWIAGSVGKVK